MDTPTKTTPNPDPTVASNDAIERAVTAERDFVKSQLEIIDARLDGMDKATELRLKAIDSIPDEIDQRIKNHASISDEKFNSIKMQFEERDTWLDEKFGSIKLQFAERDTRSERESRDNKVAVDAAFAAQKEAASEQNKSNTTAIGKSEGSTMETINKLSELFRSTTDALGGQISDAKERILRVESTKAGGRETTADNRLNVSMTISIVLFVITVATAIIAFTK